jgi:hypothetical protein
MMPAAECATASEFPRVAELPRFLNETRLESQPIFGLPECGASNRYSVICVGTGDPCDRAHQRFFVSCSKPHSVATSQHDAVMAYCNSLKRSNLLEQIISLDSGTASAYA